MSKKPTAEELTHAINAFLATMRRESMRRHGEIRVPDWAQMTPADRQILTKAVLAALVARAPAETE